MAKLEPWEFQKEDLAKLADNNFTGLLAIEAGGAKTFLSTLAIQEANPEVTLILAPLSTIGSAWIPTVRDNVGQTPRIIGNANKTTQAALADFELGYPGIYITTPQFATRANVGSWRGNMIIVDEIHSAGATAKSKLQRKLGGYHFVDGEPLSARFEHRLGLSGTPMRQDFSNMWGVNRFLWGQELNRRGQVADSNFLIWQNDRMDYKDVVTGFEWIPVSFDEYESAEPGTYRKVIDSVPHLGRTKTVKQFLTEKEPGRLFSEMPCVIMHKRREACCRHHPQGFLPTEKPQVIERTVELTAKQKKAIREMDKMMMTYIEDNPLTASISLTQKQRIRQLAMAEAQVENYIGVNAEGEEVEKDRVIYDLNTKSPIIDEIQHILSNLPEKEAVVVYTESQKFAEVITHQLSKSGFAAEEYSGVRKADLTKFGAEYQILVGVIAAVGTGTDGIQRVCNTEIFADQPISLTAFEQATARTDRIGAKGRVQRYVIHDDQGISQGRMEDLWTKKAMVSRSMATKEGI